MKRRSSDPAPDKPRHGRWQQLQAMAQREVSAILDALPGHLQATASRLPVIYESQPDPRRHGTEIDSDTLGLFIGAPFGEAGLDPGDLPPHIVLFLETLWDFADADTRIFRSEVRTTYLHELGHYLGLDEADLDLRGLA